MLCRLMQPWRPQKLRKNFFARPPKIVQNPQNCTWWHRWQVFWYCLCRNNPLERITHNLLPNAPGTPGPEFSAHAACSARNRCRFPFFLRLQTLIIHRGAAERIITIKTVMHLHCRKSGENTWKKDRLQTIACQMLPQPRDRHFQPLHWACRRA